MEHITEALRMTDCSAHTGPAARRSAQSAAHDGRRLLRLEVRNALTPIERKPPWIKTRAKAGSEYTELKSPIRREGVHTVCGQAPCPNIFECGKTVRPPS
ncbi:hypothetical protein MOKP64_12320 [Mycobacterium avium subsp. hominissuis]